MLSIFSLQGVVDLLGYILVVVLPNYNIFH